MKNEDVDLIQHILAGDEGAFTALMERHRKWVHSLAWREIGDFHIAQEITQDTFIQAFKSLPNLRDPNRFSGWLHVIAKRQCIEWLRRKPAVMQSLDEMPKAELEQLFYAQYVEKEQAQASIDELHEVVECLLQKLPTTEHSVMVLHYYKGLTCEEMSALLDISLNTVKSRLHRARKRLEREESMIRETLRPSLLKSHPRGVGIRSTAVTETDEHLAEGGFNLIRTDKVFTSSGFGTRGHGGGDPSPMYMLLHYISHGRISLLRFPLTIGSHWEEEGPWESRATTTLENHETVEVSGGTFSGCLKHKTVFTDANVEDTNAELRTALVNGTRYLWFAKGVGLVKMRYEHSNGDVTEAELIKYKIPLQSEEYLPAQIGTQWTYKWKNAYRSEATIEEWRVIRNFSEPNNLHNPMELASARYEIKIDADEPRVADVKCILTPKGSSEEGDQKSLPLFMSHFGTEWMYDGYSRYLRDLTAADANGETLVVEEIDKTQWIVETRDESPVTLQYKVLLNHDEREWPPGRDEAPYVQDNCIFSPGYALFIVGEVDDIELYVDVPDNWHVSTPWERIGNNGHRFVCKGQDDLMYAYLVLGEHAERLVKSVDTEIVLALGGHFKASMDEVQGVVETLLHAYSGIYGGTPKDRMLFVANPYGEKGRMSGGVSRRSISLLIGDTLDEARRDFWVPIVAHEIGHIWLGKGAISFSGQEYWFSEGFAEYYSRVLCARLGLTSEEDFIRNLKQTWGSYLSRQGKFSIREAGEDKSANRELVYEGGSLIAAALDLQIRTRTENRRSLDDVMQQMYQEFGLTENEYTIDDIVRIVSQIAGENFEPFFTKYVTGKERLPLAEYLKNVGVDVEIEFDEDLPDLGCVFFEMLGIHSFSHGDDGLIIRGPWKGQDEDNLVGINSIPVKTFDDIRRIAKDWKSGDVVVLTLERNGATVTVPIKLDGTYEKPPLVTNVVDVTITKRADRTNLQRAIWSAMLGTCSTNF